LRIATRTRQKTEIACIKTCIKKKYAALISN